MARAPPAARLALDVRFPDADVAIEFDGTNFEDYVFALETTLTSCPAAVAILHGDLTRPLDTDARDIFPYKTGVTMYDAFRVGSETYSTGVMAISIPCTDPDYGTVCSAGVFNSPWAGDVLNYAAAQADYAKYEAERRASFVSEGKEDEYEASSKETYIQGAIDARLDHERAIVIGMRQREWDACNSFLYRTLVTSTRPADLAVIRPHMGDGRAAWEALRATHAGSDNTRAGLTSAFIALSDLKTPSAGNYNQVADVVTLAVQRVRNNALAQRDPGELLDVMQLGLTMAQLAKQSRYSAVITTVRLRPLPRIQAG